MSTAATKATKATKGADRGASVASVAFVATQEHPDVRAIARAFPVEKWRRRAGLRPTQPRGRKA